MTINLIYINFLTSNDYENKIIRLKLFPSFSLQSSLFFMCHKSRSFLYTSVLSLKVSTCLVQLITQRQSLVNKSSKTHKASVGHPVEGFLRAACKLPFSPARSFMRSAFCNAWSLAAGFSSLSHSLCLPSRPPKGMWESCSPGLSSHPSALTHLVWG